MRGRFLVRSAGMAIVASLVAAMAGLGPGVSAHGFPRHRQAQSRTHLVSSANPSVSGESVTFTATVFGTSYQQRGRRREQPTGTVAFRDGHTTIAGCSAVALTGGKATCTTTFPSVGGQAITAAYSGNRNFSGSFARLWQTVKQASTTTALASSANPSVSGESVTYTATIAVTAPGSGTPTGTVVFKDGTTTITGCSAVAVASGKATCTTSYPGVGSQAITATYSGDTNFAGSASTTVTQAVNQAATTTTVTSSANPSRVHQSVTFTATVAVTAPGAGAPTGTVTFKDGTTTLGTGTLSTTSGVTTATFATSSLPQGAQSITATYGGDTNFAGSTSAALTQHVVFPFRHHR
jgi:hypothetical protein